MHLFHVLGPYDLGQSVYTTIINADYSSKSGYSSFLVPFFVPVNLGTDSDS